MILTKQEINEVFEKEFQKDIQNLLEIADLYGKSKMMLSENKLSKSEYETLNEGLWEKAKYYMSKLGRYKAGMIGDDGKSKVKIFGKKEIDQASATKIQTILDKKGNEMIKQLNDTIKKQNPEFPNNEKGEQFLKTVMDIAKIYDSIVASAKKDPKEEGFLPVDAANTMIEDLAAYVQKFLDVDLAAAYTVMDSEEEKVKNKKNTKDDEDDDNTEEDGELLTDNVEDINEDEAADVRAKLQAKKGQGKDRESIRMGKQGLGSNRLPIVLSAVGASLGVLGWMAQSNWLKTLLESWLNTPGKQGSEAIYETITGGEADEKGMLHWMGKIMGKKMETGADVTSFIEKYGAENVSHMFDGNGAGDSMEQVGKLQQLVGGDGASKSVGELFRGDTFGDMKQGRNLFGISKSASFVAKTLVKSATKAVAGGTAGTVLAGKIAAIGSVLAPLGIGLLAAGATVKLMRMKGQRQSRAKTLQDLLNSIQPIETSEVPNNPPVLPEQPKDETKTDGGGKNDKEGLFNDVNDFFKFANTNKKTITSSSLDSNNSCSDLKVGMEFMYTPEGGEEDVFVVIKLDGMKPGFVGAQRKSFKEEGSSKGRTYISCSKVNPIKSSGNNDKLKQKYKELINKWVSSQKKLGKNSKPGQGTRKRILNQAKKELKLESFMRNKNILTEKKEGSAISNKNLYIKDPSSRKILIKNLKNKNKLIFFEGFIKQLDNLKKKFTKIKPEDFDSDPKIAESIRRIQTNPLMKMPSSKLISLFNVDSEKVDTLSAFINPFLNEIYELSFKGIRFKDIISKSNLGENYIIEADGKKNNYKRELNIFGKSCFKFIKELMVLFSYLKKAKETSKQKTSTKKQQESFTQKNPLITEEINRIKSLMFKIS